MTIEYLFATIGLGLSIGIIVGWWQCRNDFKKRK